MAHCATIEKTRAASPSTGRRLARMTVASSNRVKVSGRKRVMTVTEEGGDAGHRISR